MNIVAYFKKLALVDGSDGDVLQLQFHIQKGKVTAEDLESIFTLQGGAVRLSAHRVIDDDYLSPAEKKRDEEEKERRRYEEVMSEKQQRLAMQEIERQEIEDELDQMDPAPLDEDQDYNPDDVIEATQEGEETANSQISKSDNLGEPDPSAYDESFTQEPGESPAEFAERVANAVQQVADEAADANAEIERQADEGQKEPSRYFQDPDGSGKIYFVGQGLGSGDSPWFSLHKMPGKGSHRVRSANLPERPTRAQAWDDLVTYAEKHGLILVDEELDQDLFNIPEPVTQNPEKPAQVEAGGASGVSAVFPDVSTPLSAIVRKGDKIIMREDKRLPKMPVKPVVVKTVDVEHERIEVGLGMVSFVKLDENYRLYLCEETVAVGDQLVNIESGEIVKVTFTGTKLARLAQPGSQDDERAIEWETLDGAGYRMLARAQPQLTTV